MKDKRVIDSILKGHGFDSLNDTQKNAFNKNILDINKNQMLIARTGSGKTFCAEAYMKKYLEEKKSKIAYLVPSVQLIGGKAQEIREWFDGEVGEKDYTKEIVVATFESFYYKVARDRNVLDEYKLVILDDFHEIYSDFRGENIEKVITMVKQNDNRIFSLSATIGNPEEISEWMDANLVVDENAREIKLDEYFVEYENKKNEIIEFIRENPEKEPFLIFNNSRNNSENRAEKIAEKMVVSESREYKSKMEKELKTKMTPKLEGLANLMNNGVAYHHAGLPVEVRNFIEEEFRKGNLKIISATTTIGYGFDAPVKSVIVADLKRYDPQKGWMTYVGVFEFVQWIGRAARPGHDIENGYAVSFCTDEEKAYNIYSKEERELERITSKLEDSLEKFICELIDMGWVTEEEILGIIEETLLSDQASQNSDLFENSEIIKARVKESLEKVEEKNMIEIKIADQSFDLTTKGDSIIEFNYDTLNRYPFWSIVRWYDTIKDIDDPYMYVYRLCENFEIKCTNDQIGDTTELAKIISKTDLPDDEYSRTTIIILNYWCSNYSMDKIADETGYDTTPLYRVAKSIATIMESSKNMISDIGKNFEWHDNLKDQIKFGISKDEIVFAKLNGVGRFKVRRYKKWAEKIASQNNIEEETLIGKSEKIMREAGKEKFIKSLSKSDLSRGIGEKTASKIANLVESPSKEKTSKNSFSKVEDESTKLSDF